MATMIDGESYLGRVMVRPLSKSGGRYHVPLAVALSKSQVWRPHIWSGRERRRNHPFRPARSAGSLAQGRL